jgi:hypothetical protein
MAIFGKSKHLKPKGRQKYSARHTTSSRRIIGFWRIDFCIFNCGTLLSARELLAYTFWVNLDRITFSTKFSSMHAQAHGTKRQFFFLKITILKAGRP